MWPRRPHLKAPVIPGTFAGVFTSLFNGPRGGGLRALAGLVLGVALAPASSAAPPVQTNFHGWRGCWVLRNGTSEAVVAPAVGRIVSFRLLSEPEGPFWLNPLLLGRPMTNNPWSLAGSYGGDKTWPAPQSAWNWPPPDVFDAVALEARPDGSGVVMESKVSPRFGIRTRRRIVLSGAAALRVETTYLKVEGPPVEVSVWVITQTRPDAVVYLPGPATSAFPDRHSAEWAWPLDWARLNGDLIEMRRDPRGSHKIGNDAGGVAWVGPDTVLTLTPGAAAPGGRYPDRGCRVEVYSNPDPAGYFELETLGPLARLSQGDQTSATNTYQLSPRSSSDARADAVRALERARP